MWTTCINRLVVAENRDIIKTWVEMTEIQSYYNSEYYK